MNTEKRIYYLHSKPVLGPELQLKNKVKRKTKRKGPFVFPANLEREQYFYKIYPPSNKKLLREK